MTKEEFLARCGNAYDMGLCNDNQLRLLATWADAVLRAEHTFLGKGQDQFDNVKRFMRDEAIRIHGKEQYNDGHGGVTESHVCKTLANDAEGYNLVYLTSLLAHPCQKCAVDPTVWHTRAGFCQHREKQP